MVSADGTTCTPQKRIPCYLVSNLFSLLLTFNSLFRKWFLLVSNPPQLVLPDIYLRHQHRWKSNTALRKMSLWQAVFNKQGAKLAFSCPPKVLTVLLQMQKGKAWEQILPSTLAILHSIGILECGNLVWGQNPTQLAKEKFLTLNSWNVHGRSFATSGYLWVCKKAGLLWKYSRLWNHLLCNSLGWETCI